MVGVGSVSVLPSVASLLEGESLQFSALVQDDRGSLLEQASVDWSSDDPDILSIDPDGVAQAVQYGQATIRAEFLGVEGVATVNILDAPGISPAPAALAFFGDTGGPSPPPQLVLVTNSGGGTLTDLTVDVQYTGATGWLATTVTGTPVQWTVTVTPETTGMPGGVYSATLGLSSPADPKSPVLVPVTLSLAGVTVTESDGTTVVDEAGGIDDFTVVLDREPASDVVVTVISSDPGEVTVSPSMLTFSPDDWNVQQLVTVTGQDDAISDGDVETTVTVSVDDAGSDDAFDAVSDRTVIATTIDDDPAGLTIEESDGTTVVSEAGGIDDFTVVLDVAPMSDVVLRVTSGDPGEVTVSPERLVFTPDDWSAPRAVSVIGQDDEIVDGDVLSAITVSVDGAGSDDAFDALGDWVVIATTTDDDVAGLTIEETGIGTSVRESGSTDEFTVVLDAAPLSSVVLTITSSDPGEATVAPTMLTFGPESWAVPQTVTVTGVDDDLRDGTQVSAVVVSVDAALSDDAFDVVPDQSVTVTTRDDDRWWRGQ